MDSVRQAVSRTALGLAEYITPVLRQSKFRETGVITPEEFVVAGDFLVHHCPTWQWSGGEPARARSYLPPNKQYLVTKGVPCYRRVSHLTPKNADCERIVEERDADGGWVDTFFMSDNDKPASDLPEDIPYNIKAGDGTADSGTSQFGANSGECDDDDDEEAEDMEAFIQSGMLDEADAQTVASRIRKNPASSDQPSTADNTDGILQTRTYDLYITYDKYYQTARLWLYGYDEQHKPLSEADMYADFSQDHAKKTVTTESHPHLSGAPMPSIHPCKQADVIRKLMETMAEGGAELGVHQYLLIFLKFVQTVIPTIEYDYTRNFKIS
nr:unnamed protein product [Spirometra erinaceieuropaei]